MALFHSQKREHQSNQKPGLIRSLFSLLKSAVPQAKSRSTSQSQEQSASAERPANSKAKSSKKQAAPSANRNKKEAQASDKRQASKTGHKNKSKSAHANRNRNRNRKHEAIHAQQSEHNPKDVIPDQPQDPAHSQGHRKIHIEKELH